MNLVTVDEVEIAIQRLSPKDRDELFQRLASSEQAFDRRMQADFAAGLLDELIHEALNDDEQGRTRPLTRRLL